MPQHRDDIRAWVQARVDEAGSIDDSRPADFTQAAWRAACKELGVTAKPKKAATLEEALQRLAERVS